MPARFAARHLVGGLVVILLAGLIPAATAGPVRAAGNARIYLVAVGDNGASGQKIGCGDSLVAVDVDVPETPNVAGKIERALDRLFQLNTQFLGESGLYNALYRSSLRVSTIDIQGDTAAVYLTGTLSLGGTCDDPRALGQIVATASQFPGVTKAIVILNGGPLTNAVGGLTFPLTGHRVEPPFYPYWERQGGLPIFGYPLSDQLVEGGYRAQYFERQRLEHHPENAAPYDILFGLVGRQAAERRGLLGSAPFGRATASGGGDCEYVATTGHNLCAGFRAYWHGHGLDFGEPGFSGRESLALFGYPISEVFEERLEDGKTYRVQYFERVRMEYHPENRAPYDILLGRLTADLVPAGR